MQVLKTALRMGVVIAVLPILAGAQSREAGPVDGHLVRVAGAACMKSGERSSGFNKVCYYDCLGSEVARTIGSTQLCPMTINGGGSEAPQAPKPVPAVCFKKGEETTGMTKQCAYDCLGSLRVVTIKSVQLCPMNIRQ